MKKPTVLLDCDGVLADFTSLALSLIEEETGIVYRPEEIPRWDVFESLGHPELWEEFEKKASVPGLCAGMDLIPGSLSGVNLLKKHCEIYIVTAPVDAMPWMYERAHWIEENFDIPRHNVIFAHAKHCVKGDIFVDDKPDNVTKWAEKNPKGLAVLWEHPYNTHVALPNGIIRTSDWKELDQLAKEVSDG